MNTSQRGIDLIKSFESFAPEVYLCPAHKRTIGYGHVLRDGEALSKLTEHEAVDLLLRDLTRYEAAVLACVDVEMSQNQFDACVSLAYNVGPDAFAKSMLVKLMNQWRYTEAADQFLRWDHCAGKVLPGLTRRRIAERELFLESL